MIIRIIKGPREGHQFTAKDGLKIGRSAADINLKDSKASSRHAEIRLAGGKNDYVLVDLGSTNGIKFNGEKVLELKLEPGIEFGIGSSRFTVENDPTSSKESSDSWRDAMYRIASVAPAAGAKKQPLLSGFKSLIELQFTEGPQKGERYTLGYGPRQLGSKSFDFPIRETGAPSICFSVVPDSQGLPIFKTDHETTVLLNENAVSSEKLKEGDTISILNTRLKVSFK